MSTLLKSLAQIKKINQTDYSLIENVITHLKEVHKREVQNKLPKDFYLTSLYANLINGEYYHLSIQPDNMMQKKEQKILASQYLTWFKKAGII